MRSLYPAANGLSDGSPVGPTAANIDSEGLEERQLLGRLEDLFLGLLGCIGD